MKKLYNESEAFPLTLLLCKDALIVQPQPQHHFKRVDVQFMNKQPNDTVWTRPTPLQP